MISFLRRLLGPPPAQAWTGLRSRDPRLVGAAPSRLSRVIVLIALIDLGIERATRKGHEARREILIGRYVRAKQVWLHEVALAFKHGPCQCDACAPKRTIPTFVIQIGTPAPVAPPASGETLKSAEELNQVVASEMARQAERRRKGAAN